MPKFKFPVTMEFRFTKDVKVLQRSLVNQEAWELAAEENPLPRLSNREMKSTSVKEIEFDNSLEFDPDTGMWEGELEAVVHIQGLVVEVADDEDEARDNLESAFQEDNIHTHFLPTEMGGWELDLFSCDAEVGEVVASPRARASRGM